MWVHFSDTGGVVAVAVVTLSKHGHTVDARRPYGCGKLCLVKMLANALNVWTCVKVEMYSFHLHLRMSFSLLYIKGREM